MVTHDVCMKYLQYKISPKNIIKFSLTYIYSVIVHLTLKCCHGPFRTLQWGMKTLLLPLKTDFYEASLLTLRIISLAWHYMIASGCVQM